MTQERRTRCRIVWVQPTEPEQFDAIEKAGALLIELAINRLWLARALNPPPRPEPDDLVACAT